MKEKERRELTKLLFSKFGEDEVRDLLNFKDLDGIKALIKGGQAEIKYLNLVDYVAVLHDILPISPEKGFKLEPETQKIKELKIPLSKKSFHLSDSCLYLSDKQKSPGCCPAIDIKNELENKYIPFGEPEYHFLLQKEIIPERWERYSLIFLNSIYSNDDGRRLVRSLSFRNDAWISDFIDYEECAIYGDSRALVVKL